MSHSTPSASWTRRLGVPLATWTSWGGFGAVGEFEWLVVQDPDLFPSAGVVAYFPDGDVPVVVEPVEVGGVEPLVVYAHQRRVAERGVVVFEVEDHVGEAVRVGLVCVAQARCRG